MQFRHRRKGLKIRPWGKNLFLVILILVFSASYALCDHRDFGGGHDKLKHFARKIVSHMKYWRHHDVTVEDDPNLANVLFVVGHRMLMGSDRMMVNYLKTKDLDVFVKKDKYVQTSDADDMDLIIISETVRAIRVNSKFSGVKIPIICSEPRLFDDLGMTGSNNKFYDDEDANDYGYAWFQNKISILDSGFDSTNPHPLASDLGTEEVTVSSRKIRMSWGVPGDDAIPIATLVDDSTKCTIFAYEPDKVARGTGKRIGTFLFGSASRWLTPDGLDLVDATIDWALNSNKISPPNVEISAEPVFIRAGEKATLNWTITDGDSAVIDHEVGDVPVHSSYEVEPTVTTTYTITVTGPGGTTSAQVTVAVEDFFTFAQLTTGELDYQMFTFTPDGSPNFYRLCRDIVTAFPTDPAGGSILELGDDDFMSVGLSAGAQVSLFGGDGHSTFHVGSNGYITFDAGDSDASDSIFDHFDTPRISGLFDDLAPDQNGVISYKQLEDRVAVTFEDVTEYNPISTNNFQIEMFFNGTIRITYLEVGATDGIAGLSDGNSIPENFYVSDPNLYDSCISP